MPKSCLRSQCRTHLGNPRARHPGLSGFGVQASACLTTALRGACDNFQNRGVISASGSLESRLQPARQPPNEALGRTAKTVESSQPRSTLINPQLVVADWKLQRSALFVVPRNPNQPSSSGAPRNLRARVTPLRRRPLTSISADSAPCSANGARSLSPGQRLGSGITARWAFECPRS